MFYRDTLNRFFFWTVIFIIKKICNSAEKWYFSRLNSAVYAPDLLPLFSMKKFDLLVWNLFLLVIMQISYFFVSNKKFVNVCM